MKKAAVDARAFADAMSKVGKVLRKSVIPILGEVAVSIGDDRCTLTATDLGTWLRLVGYWYARLIKRGF